MFVIITLLYNFFILFYLGFFFYLYFVGDNLDLLTELIG